MDLSRDYNKGCQLSPKFDHAFRLLVIFRKTRNFTLKIQLTLFESMQVLPCLLLSIQEMAGVLFAH